MSVMKAASGLALAAAAACTSASPTVTSRMGATSPLGDAAQQFTRAINATPAKIVSATVQTFSENGIPVVTADEAGGVVTSAQVQVQGNWGGEAASQRINCGTDSLGQPIADQAPTRLTIAARVEPQPNGSLLTVSAKGENPRAKQDKGSKMPACVLTTTFVTRLLDAIQSRALTGRA